MASSSSPNYSATTCKPPQLELDHPVARDCGAALTWAAESGGEIYRRDQPGAEPGLYKAAW